MVDPYTRCITITSFLEAGFSMLFCTLTLYTSKSLPLHPWRTALIVYYGFVMLLTFLLAFLATAVIFLFTFWAIKCNYAALCSPSKNPHPTQSACTSIAYPTYSFPYFTPSHLTPTFTFCTTSSSGPSSKTLTPFTSIAVCFPSVSPLKRSSLCKQSSMMYIKDTIHDPKNPTNSSLSTCWLLFLSIIWYTLLMIAFGHYNSN